jgi:hypothetical protein
MERRTVVTGFGRGVGAIFGYAAKQAVVIHGLEPIRKEIERFVAEVAKEKFGAWVGSAVAYKASLMLQMPVISLIGDLVRACVSQVVLSSVTVTATVTGLIPYEEPWASRSVIIAVRVFTASCGYFVKCGVMQMIMPAVKTTLEKVLKVVMPLIYKGILARPFLPQMTSSVAISLTPPVAFVCADLIGFAFEEALQWLIKKKVQARAAKEISKNVKVLKP